MTFINYEFEINNPVIYIDNKNSSWLWLSPSATNKERVAENSWVRIYWPDGSIDTLDFDVYDDHKRVLSVARVYLNKTQVWPDSNHPGGERNITIIK